ncbi:MAG: coproporphyrinogen III oxidase family protein [bacterium]|nr:coproporphyrinogen III oxidase family protein [bacterium]
MTSNREDPGEAAECSPLEPAEPVEGSYFVSTYPPFSVWTEDEVAAYRDTLARAHSEVNELGLYVHVPFCAERCQYCYYLSYANAEEERIEAYVDGLMAELESYARAPAIAGREVGFVYFGGGTPSMLSEERIRRVMAHIDRCFPVKQGRELTFECAPASALPAKLATLRDVGVTRVSMGVQALDDEVLRKNKRVHTVAEVERAYTCMREVGFDVVNLDLIVGLAGESDKTFFAGVDRLVGLAPESVTLYQLEIPLNTPLYRALADGRIEDGLPTWEEKHARLARAFEELERAGYSVRSAYSAVRDPLRHRFVYQDAQYRGADLVGVGPSAFSYVGGVHHQNVASLRGYLACSARGELPFGRAHVLSADEQLVREFVLQLKLGGADAAVFRGRFGVELTEVFAEPLERLCRAGLLTLTDDADVRVTRAGLVRIDRVIPEFYLGQHHDVRYS